MRFDVRSVAAIALLSVMTASNAEERTHYDEPGLTAGREYVSQHFAERVDPFTGNLSLQFVDLFIPGNGDFDLRIQRSYNANAIDDTLSPFGRGWEIHFGRVTHQASQTCAAATPQSMALELPDGSKQTLHKSNGVMAPNSEYLTTSLWKGRCNAGAGITIFAPNGMQYDMSEADGRYWHAKRITDRHGNYFDITYTTSVPAGRKVISQIVANDNRLVSFAYGAGRLMQISGAGRIWTYQVSTASDGSNQLAHVTPPAGGGWDFFYNANLGTSVAGSYALRSMTNPFGGILTYSYGFVNFLPSSVGSSPSTVVRSKTTGNAAWQYNYSPSCTAFATDTTTVSQPDNQTIVYRHVGYCNVTAGEVWKIGLLQQKSTGTEQVETLSWSPQTISSESTTRPGYAKIDTQINRALLTQRTVQRDGLTHTTNYLSFDAYGNPQSISETGNKNRSKTLTYFNGGSAWILGLANDESIPGVGTISRTRNSEGDVISESRYGVTTTFTYDTNGSVLQKRTDKPATTYYSGYSRGIPATEARPESVTINRQVDTAGNVISESDGEFTWSYGYDGIGRLTSINFPAGSSATINWTTSSRTLTRGAFSETTQFDDFGRNTSVTREGVTRTFNYDGLGRKTFESLPGSSQGTTFTYDVLGRVTREQSPAGSKIYSYSSGDVTVTNERGISTRFDYDRYGDPDEGYVSGISPPVSSASISMSRNAIGILLSATQNGVTRTYFRDSSFFLTSINEPESGQTVFGRDGVGNMTSKSVGGQTVNYQYDGLSRVISVTGFGVPVTLDYNKRGKVISVSNGAAQRFYEYDANANMTQDRLAIDGQVFATYYYYDTIDGLSSVIHPMGKGAVYFSPDGLGRPTSATPYLSSIGHHPSGNLSSIVYANGVSQFLAENSRQLPSSITAAGIQLGLTYNYDGVGNVDSITDAYAAAESRNFAYDSIDRLTSADGPWGSGSISYDGSGNLSRQQFGSYAINYGYSSNRLTSITGSKSMSLAYNSRGNIIGNGSSTFSYDALAQMTCAKCGTTDEITYQYDGQGRRVSEEKAGRKTYFVQAPNGDLQFEYSVYGKRWTVHAYVHGKRVASESGSDALTSTASVSASTASPSYGQDTTFTATVTPSAATGTVEFIEGNRSLGVSPVVSGRASVSTTDLDVGTRTVTANYSGDADYQPAIASVSVNVVKRASSVTISAPPTAEFAASVNLSATVLGSGPTGQVQFRDGASVLGTATLTNGSASMTTQLLLAGGHAFTAEYLGDANHVGSTSAAAATTVSKGTPTATVSLQTPDRPYGQSVTFSAVVTGLPSAPVTGTVTFLDGGVPLATVALSNGTASLMTNYLSIGSHPITVSYSGDSNYMAADSLPAYQQISSQASVIRSVPPQLLEDVDD